MECDDWPSDQRRNANGRPLAARIVEDAKTTATATAAGVALPSERDIVVHATGLEGWGVGGRATGAAAIARIAAEAAFGLKAHSGWAALVVLGRREGELQVLERSRLRLAEEAWAMIAEKEAIYRELFAPVFAEVAGFKQFAQAALNRKLKVGVGTAGDQHNIAFAFSHLKLSFTPHAVVGGDEGFPGKPEPAIFLEAAKRMNTRP